ncbi:beta-1,4-glucuronyltransferase 1 [Trichonephila inaurata madagascariensis]|uniref:Beta-1,4-glucuronyltransferase 1 n=1 Tax=Trichonephila inaurata madagascariensis TaxID=2747483 RepID=A0A8X7CMF5_9ARAC|nr:beta-1,4-glucuronyltransferase 1 [Trichonephila inaurata madagascariensis]
MKSEAVESTEELRVWATVNRSRKFRLHFWEPFFIGTRDDPEFDPRLSWEGKQNKMQVKIPKKVKVPQRSSMLGK